MRILNAYTPATAGSAILLRDIEHPVHHLMLQVMYDDANLPDWGTLEKMFSGIEVQLEHVSKAGKNIPLYNKVPLSVIAEFAQNGEGSLKLFGDYDATATTQSIKGFRAPIPVCFNGGLIMDNDETLKLTLRNLPMDAGVKIDLWGVEMPSRGSEIIAFNQLSVPQDQYQKEFRSTRFTHLLLPKADSFDCIRINYTNNVTTLYEWEELEYIQDNSNDLVMHFDDSMFKVGSDGLIILNVEEAVSIQINTDGNSYQLYSVEEIVVAKPSKELVQNVELTSTVEPLKDHEYAQAEKLME